MEPVGPAFDSSSEPFVADVDVLVVGAGITGIYQLYRAREAGFSVQLLEAGGGVGGTWFWNRYPGARFDSESYTYAYLFSKELFDEWEWQEQFAPQPETERYLNHVVDRFDLRRHIRVDAKVSSAVYDEDSGRWSLTTSDGARYRTRFLVAATGVLSVPYFPEVAGREDFRGESYHTGLWPHSPVDFAGKHVAVIGTGSSGVQVIPAIADQVASLAVYQRTANWCTPLNNAPITPRRAGTAEGRLREDVQEAGHLAERVPPSGARPRHLRRFPLRAVGVLRDDVGRVRASRSSPATTPIFFSITRRTKSGVSSSRRRSGASWWTRTTAERLIPKDHRFAEKRPPFVAGYYEVFNEPNVSLLDLRQTPIVRITGDGIETTEGMRRFDVVVWATGFDFGTGALMRLGIRGRHGLALEDDWADGPKTYLGIQATGFPNLFFPGGPHAAAGNNPRYNGDQVDFITGALVYLRDHGYDTIEVDPAAESEWTNMVDAGAASQPFGESSYFFGTNIPGKARKYLLNSGGRPKLLAMVADVVESDYKAFRLGHAPGPTSTSA